MLVTPARSILISFLTMLAYGCIHQPEHANTSFPKLLCLTDRGPSRLSRQNIVTLYGCDYRRSIYWIMDLLITLIHHPELHFTDYLQSSVLILLIFISRFLSSASTEGDSSASRTLVLLSQPPVQNSCLLTTHI
jgi:hypothetical protein